MAKVNEPVPPLAEKAKEVSERPKVVVTLEPPEIIIPELILMAIFRWAVAPTESVT